MCDKAPNWERPLDNFVARMRRKLIKNEHKGGWSEMRPIELFTMLVHEVNELRRAIIAYGVGDGVADEAADVANFAMMVADVVTREDEP